MLHCRHGGAPIGSMLRIGNSDFLDRRMLQGLDSKHPDVNRRSLGNPNDNSADGIEVEGSGFSQAGLFEFLRIADVRRKEQVERRAIGKLGKEVSGGA